MIGLMMKDWWSTLQVDRGKKGILIDDLRKPTDAKILNLEYKNY